VWRKLEKSGENCKSGGEKKVYVFEKQQCSKGDNAAEYISVPFFIR
jgi:hypothetical protein